MIRLVAIAGLAMAFAASVPVYAAPQVATISAATKKAKPVRRQDAGQIACTVSGCHRIPPGCHPQTGYNWDGIPTGFDIVVCRYPRGRPG
ncbi:MAG TPA: hypothetical protein VFB29_04320 [Pseudolabrys sp.]|nr:hypothetical protein [Pseudolabrys sp.]